MPSENLERCPWCLGSPLYRDYHDQEWGVPVYDDRKQFEFLVLESAQAGLSWITILNKRENYRRAYGGFEPQEVARYGPAEVERLLADSGIVRNRRKIESSIGNARAFLRVQEKFGSFTDYLWNFTDGKVLHGGWNSLADVPPRTELSDRIARDLKGRGFTFLGGIIVYSHLQAVGLVNDHLRSCFRYSQLGGS